jgi:hypothetical protein
MPETVSFSSMTSVAERVPEPSLEIASRTVAFLEIINDSCSFPINNEPTLVLGLSVDLEDGRISILSSFSLGPRANYQWVNGREEEREGRRDEGRGLTAQNLREGTCRLTPQRRIDEDHIMFDSTTSAANPASYVHINSTRLLCGLAEA